MISQKKQNSILNQIQDLNGKIIDIYDKYLDKIAPILKQYYDKKKSYKEAFEEKEEDNDESTSIYNLILEMLTEVYSLTAKEVKNIYNIPHNVKLPISKITSYDLDGITLEERLEKWYCPKIKGNENEHYIKQYLPALSKMNQILTTECIYQKQVVMNDKLSDLCEFGIIEESPDCQHGICNQYAGEWPINELIYPPYHPNCLCEVIYEISNDFEDIEDLDLEDDID